MTAKIKLNAASGGGSFSLQAPSSSSNNRVITLPDIADGTLLTNQSSGIGKALQVVEGSLSTQVAVSTDTYTDIGISAAITPQTNSKVLVLVNFLHNMNSNQEEGFGIKLFRGSNVLYTSPPNPSEWYAYTASSGQFKNRATFHYYDTAPSGDGSTSITYKIQCATYGSRTCEFAVNGARSTITLIEIGA